MIVLQHSSVDAQKHRVLAISTCSWNELVMYDLFYELQSNSSAASFNI